MHKRDIWVIVPAFNEAAYLAGVLKALNQQPYSYVVVDDGSADNTSAIARQYTRRIITHQLNLGKGAALKTGCEYALEQGAETVIFMDSDAQHSPEQLTSFVKAIEAGSQVVLGARTFGPQMPLIKIITNRLASVFVYLLFGTYIPDIPCGYKAMTKSAFHRLKWTATGYDVELEIAVLLAKKKCKFVTVEVPTVYVDRVRGFQFLDSIKLLSKLVVWRVQP